MNFEITNELIDTIKPYTENVTVKISTDNKDWKGRDYKSDFVTIDEKNNVGFEVFDNEIIVFYFTDHYHFEDYSSELEDGEDDYILVYSDNSEKRIGGTWWGLERFLNPFAKKAEITTIYKFNKLSGCFEKISV